MPSLPPEAGVVPHAAPPPDPLVSNPLAAFHHRAAGVVGPRVEATVRLDVEPEDGVPLHRWLAYFASSEHRPPTLEKESNGASVLVT